MKTKKQTNQTKEYTRFIPKLVKQELDALEYQRKEDLYCIIDLIYRKTINYKTELQKIYGYVEIPNSVFKKLIAGSNNLNDALKLLISENIIKSNQHYVPSVFPKSYKINADLLSPKLEVVIKDKNINKRIEAIEKENKKFVEKRLQFSKTNYYNTFKIDYEAAYNYLYNKAISSIKILAINGKMTLSDADIKNVIDCKGNWKSTRGHLLLRGKELHNILHNFTRNQFKILCIKNGYLYFKRNKTNGRLDTNLTNLPTELRQFLISDEKLYNIDIKNSQPYFLYSLLKVEKAIAHDELERYGTLVIEGTFYEYLADEYYKLTGKSKTRNNMKGFLFKIFFSKPSSFPKVKEFFGGLFPNIMQYINENNTVSNSIVANKLSTIESTTIISVILPALGNLGIKPFTIHDSFVCKESEIQTIIDVINQNTVSMYGVSPNLHVKTLLEDSTSEMTEIEIDATVGYDIDDNIELFYDDGEKVLLPW